MMRIIHWAVARFSRLMVVWVLSISMSFVVCSAIFAAINNFMLQSDKVWKPDALFVTGVAALVATVSKICVEALIPKRKVHNEVNYERPYFLDELVGDDGELLIDSDVVEKPKNGHKVKRQVNYSYAQTPPSQSAYRPSGITTLPSTGYIHQNSSAVMANWNTGLHGWSATTYTITTAMGVPQQYNEDEPPSPLQPPSHTMATK